MKKKMLSLCAIILCLSFVLVGCGGKGAKFKLYAEEVNAVTTGEATEVNLGTNIKLVGDVEDISGMGYAKIQDTKGTDATTDDTYGVYSFKDSKVVFNGAKDASYITITSRHYTYITVRTPEILESVGTPATPEYYTLYSPNGEMIMDRLDTITLNRSAKYDGAIYEYWEQALLDEEPYEIVVKVTGEKATDRTILFSNQMARTSVVGVDKQWAYMDSSDPLELTQYLISREMLDSQIMKLKFYSLESGEEISSVEVDTEKNHTDQYFVGNTMYFQYMLAVDEYETEDYDYVNSGNKFKFETYKFNIATGKLTKIDVDHIIIDQSSNKTLYENKADYFTAQRVVNKRASGSSKVYYFATEKGLVEVERTFEEAIKYGDNYIGIDINGNAYIINKSGKILVDISNYDISMATDGGLIIYDSNTNKFGFIDYTGKLLSNGFEYDTVEHAATNGYFIATKTKDTTTYYFRINATTFAETALVTKVGANYKVGETDVAGFAYDEYEYVIIKEVTGTPTTYTYEFYKNDGTLYQTVTGVATADPTQIKSEVFVVDENNGYNLVEINNKIYQIKINR